MIYPETKANTPPSLINLDLINPNSDFTLLNPNFRAPPKLIRPAETVRQLIKGYIQVAIQHGASDLHFQPTPDSIQITAHVDQFRMRIGEIFERKDVFFKEIKSFCNFSSGKIGDIDDKRLECPDLGFDFRGVIFPAKDGESITLRLLERGKIFDILKYSMPEEPKQILLSASKKQEGLILLSGPTGSGKTTALYSILGSIDKLLKNVYSVEDPIEYTLRGVTQTQINKEKNITFANMIRAYMRAKPNVIMVGEIRDEETAEAAVHAANTGHLVFSTVHAVSAKRVFSRLMDLGIKESILNETILFSSAQRLLPKNCLNCLEDDVLRKDGVCKKFELESNPLSTHFIPFMPKKSRGCNQCNAGYKGMVMIFEYMYKNKLSDDGFKQSETLSDQVKHLLQQGVISVDTAFSLI